MKQPETTRVSTRFRRSLRSYENDALVQKEVGDSLLALMSTYSEVVYGRVLEIGCCTGAMTEKMCTTFSPAEIFVNDLVEECCFSTVERIRDLTGSAYSVPGNAESIDLPSQLDLVISSSTFQWLNNLPSFFQRISDALNDEGYFIFSQFCPGTMAQISELLGVGLNYTEEAELSVIVKEYFKLERIETSHYRIYFQTPREVLKHIQKTGVGGVTDFRWTPSRLRSFERDYEERFGGKQGVSLDYVSTSVVARKKAR
jgi:malonyl-CoA O-methyltransferase